MLLFEVKKIFSKPINRIALIILMLALALVSFWTIRDVHYYNEDGITTVSGIQAVSELKEAKNQWSGYLTEDVLQKVIIENNTINSTEEALSDDYVENDKAFAMKQPYLDIQYMINKAFVDFKADYDYYRIDTLPVGEVGSLYNKRISNFKSWLASEDVSETYSEDEKMFLIEKYESLETPLKYEYFEGWKTLLDTQYLPTFMILLVLVIAFLVVGIFSDEFSLKADAIFFSTKLGRGKAISAKICAGFLVITVTYWIFMLSYSAIVLAALGFDGADLAIQLNNWDAIYNISYLQYYWLTMFAGYVGCLFIIGLSMLISAKTHSTVFAISIPFILTCVTPFLGKIPALKNIMEIFPEMALRINSVIDEITLFQIGGKVFRDVEIMIPLYLILAIVMMPILYLSYHKSEVR